MATRRKVSEQRRDREVIRSVLSRFLVVLSPVTAAQLFMGPNNKPLDPRNHGLPTYGRRALERLRDRGIIQLQNRYYSLASDGKGKLEQIIADDKLLDQLHLSDKFLPGNKKEKLDPDAVARELAELEKQIAGDDAAVEAEGMTADEIDAAIPGEPKPEAQTEDDPDVLTFPNYVAARFDRIEEMVSDLSGSIPLNLQSSLDGIEISVKDMRKDVEAMIEIFFKVGTTIDQILAVAKEDHEFLMTLRESLKPKMPEAKISHAHT